MTTPLPTPRDTWCFDTERIGRHVLVYDRVDSTNTLGAALAAADEGADGLVLVANDQSAGRGQYGRTWVNRPGSSLLMSAVVRPPAGLRRPVVLTAWVAVAVAEAARELSGAQARLKWPNDLLVHGKKVCGILIELSSTAGGATVVAGLGLNLTQDADEFARAGLTGATSLGLVAGASIDARTAAAAVVRKLDAGYARLLAGEHAAAEADWKRLVGLLDRLVLVELVGGGTATGKLRDMGFDGLEVEGADGMIRVIVPESVAHIRAE